MDEDTARKILGVSKNASPDELRSRFRFLAKRYHPDVPETGDANQFILISTAYLYLKGVQLGINVNRDITNDIDYAIDIKAKIDNYFDDIVGGIALYCEKLKTRTQTYLKGTIYSASSGGELKQILQAQIALYFVDISAELSNYMKTLEDRVKLSDTDFLFGLFNNIYEKRREYWLYSLHKNPVTISEIVSQLLIFFIRNFADIKEIFPMIWVIASWQWLPFLLLLIGVFILIMQYINLQPRRQYLPPRFSISGLVQLIENQHNQMGETKKDKALNGAFWGGVVGTFLFPLIGTAIGALLGSLWGFTGVKFTEMQQKLYDNLIREFDISLQQIMDQVHLWASKSKSDIHEASIESFSRNCLYITKLIQRKQLQVRKLLGAGKSL